MGGVEKNRRREFRRGRPLKNSSMLSAISDSSYKKADCEYNANHNPVPDFSSCKPLPWPYHSLSPSYAWSLYRGTIPCRYPYNFLVAFNFLSVTKCIP